MPNIKNYNFQKLKIKYGEMKDIAQKYLNCFILLPRTIFILEELVALEQSRHSPKELSQRSFQDKVLF